MGSEGPNGWFVVGRGLEVGGGEFGGSEAFFSAAFGPADNDFVGLTSVGCCTYYTYSDLLFLSSRCHFASATSVFLPELTAMLSQTPHNPRQRARRESAPHPTMDDQRPRQARDLWIIYLLVMLDCQWESFCSLKRTELQTLPAHCYDTMRRRELFKTRRSMLLEYQNNGVELCLG